MISKKYKGGITLEINKSYIEEWLKLYNDDVPIEYQKYRNERDGENYHMTLITSQENKGLDKYLNDIELEKSYDGYVQNTNFLILGLGKKEDVYYLVCHFPAGDLLRKECKLNLFNFHITLGFNKKDDHTVSKDISTLIKPIIKNIDSVIESQYRSPSRIKQLSLLDKIIKSELYKKSEHSEYTWWYQYIIGWANIQKFDKVDQYITYLIDLHPHLGHYINLKVKKLFNNLTLDWIQLAYKDIMDIDIIDYDKYYKEILMLIELMNDNITYDSKGYYILHENQIMMISAPRNLTKISGCNNPIVYGGAMVGSNHIDFLHTNKFDMIINLTKSVNVIQKSFNGTYVHDYIEDQYPPNMTQCYSILSKMDSAKKVIIHCIGGRGRTNTIIVAYLIWKYNHSLSDALKMIEDRKVIITDSQMEFLKQFEENEIKMKAIKSIHINDETHTSVIVLMGLPGSGKSTFAQHLITNCPHNIRYLNQDELGRGKFNKLLLQYVSNIDEQKPYKIIVIDKCNTTLEERHTIIEFANRFNKNKPRIWCLWFDISVSDILLRIHNRTNHPTLSAKKAPDVIKEKEQSLVIPTKKEGFSQVVHFKDEDEVNNLLLSWDLPEINLYSNNYFKFPRTKHLYSLGSAERNDLLMTTPEQNMFLNKHIYIEEKIDGANLGISIDKETLAIKFQNRSHYVTPETHEQFQKLHQWTSSYGTQLYNIMEPGRHILFGEWLYSKHSISYDKLPSYFIAFDMYDKKEHKFYTRNELETRLKNTNIPIVPLIYEGKLKNKKEYLEKIKLNSKFYNGPIEGLYVKIPDEDNKFIIGRGKIVRTDFLTEGTKFWTHTTKPNTLSEGYGV